MEGKVSAMALCRFITFSARFSALDSRHCFSHGFGRRGGLSGEYDSETEWSSETARFMRAFPLNASYDSTFLLSFSFLIQVVFSPQTSDLSSVERENKCRFHFHDWRTLLIVD